MTVLALMTTVGGTIGLAIGSFLNVVVHRVPAGVSVAAPASTCPRCGHPIRARDNVPVLSWLLLRGRCRDCALPISVRYPLVELVTALLFVAVVVRFGPTVVSAAAPRLVVAAVLVLGALLYLVSISVALALIDLDVHRLPNALVLPAYPVIGALLVAASALDGDWPALGRALVGLVGLGGGYLLLALAVPGGMGLGDVKLAGVLGFVLAYLGWGPLTVGAFGAFVLGGTFAIGLLTTGRAKRRTGIPFGPWMLVGAWIGVFAGEAVLGGYLQFTGLA
ncbi:prepilin peptidase [Curtobacterium subtropicum]